MASIPAWPRCAGPCSTKVSRRAAQEKRNEALAEESKKKESKESTED